MTARIVPHISGYAHTLLKLADADALAAELTDTGSGAVTIAFATPGTSSFSMSQDAITWKKFGPVVIADVNLQFTPTIGTGSGDFIVSGLPYTPARSITGTPIYVFFTLSWGTGYTQINPLILANSTYKYRVSGSGKSSAIIGAGNMSSANYYNMSVTLIYWTDA